MSSILAGRENVKVASIPEKTPKFQRQWGRNVLSDLQVNVILQRASMLEILLVYVAILLG